MSQHLCLFFVSFTYPKGSLASRHYKRGMWVRFAVMSPRINEHWNDTKKSGTTAKMRRKILRYKRNL